MPSPFNPPLAVDDTFNPALFVGREQELAQLIEWATAPNVRYRLKTVIAPPGYGKSWSLSELETRLTSRDGIFIIRVPTLTLKSEADIEAWFLSVVEAARVICPDVRHSEGDTLPEQIAHLLEDLCETCTLDLRLLLIVDSFDELVEDERRILEKYLLEQFWRKACTRFVIAFRDELSLMTRNLRRSAEQVYLEVFTPQDGEEQLKRRVEFQNHTDFSAQDLLSLIPPYNWTHPEINSYLYEIAEQKHNNSEDLSFTANDLRDSWQLLIVNKLKQEKLTFDIIEADLKTIAGHTEETWTVSVFGKMCDCSELEANRRIQKLMALSLVTNKHSRYKIVDGIREIIRAEMDIRTLGQKKQKQELSS